MLMPPAFNIVVGFAAMALFAMRIIIFAFSLPDARALLFFTFAY